MKTYTQSDAVNYSVNDGSKYSKPIRFYSDVDGVFNHFFTDPEVAAGWVNKKDIILESPVQLFSDEMESKQIIVDWVDGAPEAYHEFSNHSLVDFVWLTNWRKKAPLILDDMFNINSLGQLVWDKKMTDYYDFFKVVAIEDDQKSFPSKVIWVDDTVASAHNVEKLEKIVGKDNLLVIKPDSFVGLTAEHIETIRHQIDLWSKNLTE